MTNVGLSIGDPNVRVKIPTFDRWRVNYNYIFRKYISSSLNVLYTNCLVSLKVLCLYQMMALRKAEIYSMFCTMKYIVWICSRDWLVVWWFADIGCPLLTMVYDAEVKNFRTEKQHETTEPLLWLLRIPTAASKKSLIANPCKVSQTFCD